MLFDVDPQTGVAWHQATRIQSLCKAAEQYVQEIRRLGHDGQGNDGSRYVPLAGELWERLAGPLAELERLAEATAARAGGRRAKARERAASATRAAISGRLAMLEEVAADLKPPKFEASYGAVPEAMRQALAEAARAMEGLVAMARAVLEAEPSARAGAGGEERGARGG